MSGFEGKAVIITGAGTGLGPVLTRRFVDEGARVLISGRRQELLTAVAAECGERVIAFRADVTVEADVVAMVDAAMTAFGQVDVLVNNAAQPGQDKFIWEQTLENWNNTIAVDVTAAMLCSREVIRRSMLERRTGSIVNMSSTGAWNGQERKSHYCTAKAGLRTLTKVLALEGGPFGIRANCVVPGAIDTELYRRWVSRIAGELGISYEERYSALVSATALRTVSLPDDIANAILFVASDAARTITGQSLTVDAGGVMVG